MTDVDGGDRRQPVLQVRCVRCKLGQFGPAVVAISNGRCRCATCGHKPPIFYDLADYRAALNAHETTEGHAS